MRSVGGAGRCQEVPRVHMTPLYDCLQMCATLRDMANKRSVSQETAIVISPQVVRRFILGKQGLWPGRRWAGAPGTKQAMRAMEHVQLDPLHIVARRHDIKLHSRVTDYTPGLWETLTYGERKFFDWGGWLAVRPMEELPHWRVMMRRNGDYPSCAYAGDLWFLAGRCSNRQRCPICHRAGTSRCENHCTGPTANKVNALS